MPAGTSLTGLRATVSPSVSVGGTTDPLRQSLSVPAIELNGCATSQDGVAEVLAAMRRIDGVQRVSLSSSERNAKGVGGSSGSATPGAGSDCRAGSFKRAAFSMTVFYDAPATPASAATGTPATGAAAATAAPRGGRHRPGEHHHSREHDWRNQVTGRDRIVVMVVAAVALLGAFFFLAVSPKRAEVKAVDAKIATAQQRLDAARSSVATAQQAKRDYDTDYAAVARLGKAVPLDDNVPSLIYQLQSASHSSKVDFRSLKLESSGAGAPAAPAATAAAAPATAPDASKSGSSSSTLGPAAGATPAPATQLAAAALPPGATVGAAGFPTMPFTFIFDGSFFDMEHMLRDVNRFITVDGKSVSVRGRLLASTASRSRPPRRASRP